MKLWIYGLIVAGILGLLPFVKALLDVIDRVRGWIKGNPTADEKFATKREVEDLAKALPAAEHFATKTELREAEQRIDKRFTDFSTSITSSIAEMKVDTRDIKRDMATMSRDVATLARSLGKVEGKQEAEDHA